MRARTSTLIRATRGLQRQLTARLTPVGSICLVIWILAGLFGIYQIASALRAQVRALSLDEQTRRLTTWSPIYGFGAACASRLLPHASLVLVDPTGIPVTAPTSASAYGQAQDVDIANAAAFVYTVYPRNVALLGHAPASLDPGLLSADYVALWEQVSYRPPAAQAAGQATERMLRADLLGREVCAYTDTQGDRGLVFAVSQQSVAALTAAGGVATQADAGHLAAPGPSPFASWTTYARALLAMICLWGIGALLLRVCGGRALTWRLSAALAFPLGCLAATVELLVFSMLGISWSVTALLLPWLLVALAAAWHWRSQILRLTRRRARGATEPRGWAPLAIDERIAVGVLVILGALVIATAPIQLPYSDGFQMYYFKARAFFADRSMVPYYTHASALSFSIPAHPPLVPLSVTWLYLFIGGVDEHTSLLLWPALFLSLLAAFYVLTRPLASRRLALWCTVALALIGNELTGSAIRGGFADMPLAVYLFMGCGLLWHWTTPGRQSPRLLLVAALFLGAAALTKEEGFVAASVALIAFPLLARRRSGAVTARAARWVAPLGAAVCVFLLTIAAWQVLRLRYPVPELLLQPGNRGTAVLLQSLIVAAVGLVERAIVFWPAPLALALLWAIERRDHGERLWFPGNGRLLFLASVVLVQLAADVVGMATNPSDVSAEVSHTASRLLLQLVPLLFLGTVELWPQLLVHDAVSPPEVRPAEDAVLAPAESR
jgi:hypothetical protein